MQAASLLLIAFTCVWLSAALDPDAVSKLDGLQSGLRHVQSATHSVELQSRSKPTSKQGKYLARI